MCPDFVRRKILLLGDPAVGKTSLIRRFVIDKFLDEYFSTIGMKVTKKVLRVEAWGRSIDLTLLIWDILGQRAYREIQEFALQGVKGVLFVYDLTRPDSKEGLEDYWIPKLRAFDKSIPMVVIGNKVDLVRSKPESEQEIEALARKYGTRGFVSSAKTGESVEDAFLLLGRAVIEATGLAHGTKVVA